jgi:1-deoxy-D-xylulose-5-phosphate synthase
VVHDVAVQKLPVRFAIDRAGFVGADGPTHAGSFDIMYLASLPNFVVMAPSDEVELARMVKTAAGINDRPSAFRYPRGEGLGIDFPKEIEPIEIGKARIIKQGSDVAILSLGTRLSESTVASNILDNKGYSTTVVDARFAKPLDEAIILELASQHKVLITIEEGCIGGFGSHVNDLLLKYNLLDKNIKVKNMYFPDDFVEHNDQGVMYKEAGLDADGIVDTALAILEE